MNANPYASLVVPFLWVIWGMIIYFIPSFIAYDRKKKNHEAILILNLLLGWTFVGWVVALVWAVTKDD